MMMSQPSFVASNALLGKRVALSVSDSSDLPALGLSEDHLKSVVAESARAIAIAGGIVVYGGHLGAAGFTTVIMEEVYRFVERRVGAQFYIPLPAYQDLSTESLERIEERLGLSGELFLVASDGTLRTVGDLASRDRERSGDEGAALTAMRRRVSADTDARLIVGGKLSNYSGREPGVLEEARLTLEGGKVLYVAGGYGGAAAAVARALSPGVFRWAPEAYPHNHRDPDVSDALRRVLEAHQGMNARDGLEDDERDVLYVSHRPSDVATTTVVGLSRLSM